MDYHRDMSDSLSKILSNQQFNEPPELKQIKDFVESKIGIIPKISIQADSYILFLPSAAAAGALRPSLFKLQKEIDSKKRILIRIS